ncbi:MAG: class II aldolase/adducin family protein [Chloroflexi bacterium]|nr:MAG: class II aldolase/adducin family protein [Chloroflexota bacterium]MBL1195483.1 class II aldolase/adducin family protein [Chloroflexota bacterium]NOH12765.1 hypothetical protein [Chloroflexota bacterium]
MLKGYQRVTNQIVSMVNQNRGLGTRTRNALAPRKVRQDYLKQSGLAAVAGLTAGNLAEASIRLQGGRLLINTKDSWLADLSDDDLCITTINNTEETLHSAPPPRHVRWHQQLYARQSCQAVVLLQPSAALAFAASEKELDVSRLKDAVHVVGAVPILDPEQVEEHASHSTSMLIRGYGVLAVGSSLPGVIARVETFNRWCEAMLLVS